MRRAWLKTAGLLMLSACKGPTPVRHTSGGADLPVEKGRAYGFGFDSAERGGLPAEFEIILGDWAVVADDQAQASGRSVIRQRGSYRNPDFPRVVVKHLAFDDLTLRVSCRPEQGSLDQVCGLVFRFVDSDNYYVTRANALEDNVRLYRVVKGDRQQLASADRVVRPGQWHVLEATARGPELRVSWDGEPLLSVNDGTFQKGKVGLWTKADSVTAFRALQATAE